MKIAFVVHDYRRLEGHSRYVVELASRFAQEHEVHVFTNRIEGERDARVSYHHIHAWRPNALAAILSFAVSATFQVPGGFDIIHNQGLCGLRGNVFTAHICVRAWHNALRRVSGRLAFHEWVSGNVLSVLDDLFYRCARRCHVIAVSKRIERDLRTLYRAKMPMTVIYHGVDLSTFAPDPRGSVRSAVRAEIGLEHQHFTFIFVGDLRKGGRQCIQALSHLPCGHLLFVSRSADLPFRSLAEQLGLAGRVHFLGATTEVQKYYRAADALLLPTPYDSFAMVVAEAMACSLPVIVSREAGASELIEHAVNGILLEDFTNVDELAEKMELLQRDRVYAARIGAAGRRTVEQYSWDRVADETMQLYRRVLSNHAGDGA